MKEWLKKYWWLLVIIILLLFLPLFINCCYYMKSDCSALHEPSAWTSFWASYLSSIASFVMVFMTWRTIKQSKEQSEANRIANEAANEENRKANKEENEKNYQLQLKVMRYQQESQKLATIRTAVVEHLLAYNFNDIELVINKMAINPIEAHMIMKDLYDRIARTNIAINILMPQKSTGTNWNTFIKAKGEFLEKYRTILADIQLLILTKIKYGILTIENVRAELPQYQYKISSIMNNLIATFHPHIYDFSAQPFTFEKDFITQYIKSIPNISGDIQKASQAFIIAEENKVNTILERE